MDFDRLRALVWTVDEGTVSAAALRLHRTQPAVTRLLKTLEESVGYPLIDRAARPLAPTPAGRRVVEVAREILQMADNMMAAVQTEAVPRMSLRLGVSRALLWHLSGAAFATPPAHLRELDYRIRTGWSHTLYRAFCRKEIDCAVLLMPLDWSPRLECVTSLVRKESLVVIAPRPSRGSRKVRSISDGNHEQWVLNPDGCGFRGALARALSRKGQRLHVRYEIDAAPQEHVSLVAAGLGLSIVPVSTLRHHPHSGAVVKRSIGDESFDLGVWFVANEPVAAIDGLQNHLQRSFGGGQPRPARTKPSDSSVSDVA